jgi:hypothetical protein
MNKLYILVAVVLFSVSFTSCTAEDISESARTHADDTGGQSGTIDPPPPPIAKVSDTGGQTGNNPIKP